MNQRLHQRIQDVSPLLLLILFGIAFWYMLESLSEANRRHYVDPWTLGAICFTYALAVLVMLYRTGRGPWTILTAGLVATLLADCTLYFFVLAQSRGWDTIGPWTIFTYHIVGPTKEGFIYPEVTSSLSNIVRTLLFVGAPFVVTGLLQDWYVSSREEATGLRQDRRQVQQDSREERSDQRTFRQDRRSDRQDRREVRLDDITALQEESNE